MINYLRIQKKKRIIKYTNKLKIYLTNKNNCTQSDLYNV